MLHTAPSPASFVVEDSAGSFYPATDAALLDQLRRDAVRTGRVYDNLAAELAHQHGEWREALDTLRAAEADNARPVRALVHTPAWLAQYRADARWHAVNCGALNRAVRKARAEMQTAQSVYFREAARRRAEAGLMARGIADLVGGVVA